jgi:hypothetical protein
VQKQASRRCSRPSKEQRIVMDGSAYLPPKTVAATRSLAAVVA